MRSYADPDGKLVPRALTWKDLGDFTVGPQKFARYKQRNTVKVGEAADRYQNYIINAGKNCI